MFTFNAKKNQLVVIEQETVTTESVNVYRCHFDFDDAWDGLKKIVSFRVGKDVVSVPLNDGGECTVPKEILPREAANQRLYVGVTGKHGSHVVLPTIWAFCGTVKEGASVGRFPCFSGDNAPHVELERNGPVVRIRLCGLDGYTGDDMLQLHLYHASRHRGRKFRWRHPANFDAAAGSDRWGYGLLAGKICDGWNFPPVPGWMPNNGFMQTEIPITDEMLAGGYLELDMRDYLMPLRKPGATFPVSTAWDTFGTLGLSRKNTNGCSHLFRFHVVKDGVILARCRDTLRARVEKDSKGEGATTYTSIF